MGLDEDSAQIVERVSQFESDHSKQLSNFSKNNKFYRAIPTKQRQENQSNTFYPEMNIEVEAIATAVHEMIFSDSSGAKFFQFTGRGGMDSKIRAMVSQAAIEKQMTLNKMESKSLGFLRKLCLQGTMPVNVPWRVEYKSYHDGINRASKLHYDSWDFEPFDIVNFGFDDSTDDIERGEFAYQILNVKPHGAAKMRRLGIWDGAIVDSAIGGGFQRNVYDMQQRMDAGYQARTGTRGLTAIDYMGTIPSRGDDDVYWAVVDRGTGKFLRQPQLNPYFHAEKKWLVGKWITLPGEFYGIGIGDLNYRTQSELNDRRNFINDLLYASLYNMWLKRSDSGLMLPGNKMTWRPHQVLEADGIGEEFLRALRPDLGGLSSAINLENIDIERMRRTSGATSSLQAVATGVTATESQSIQSEATRRVKAMVRSQIASFYRDFVTRAHQLNLQFLDKPLLAKLTNEDGNEVIGDVTREDLILQPDINVKLTLDLDFRPHKRRELIEWLQVLGQLNQSGLLTQRHIIPDAIIDELAQTYNMDPRKFYSKEGMMELETQRAMGNTQTMQNAQQEIISESPAAQQFLQSPQAQMMAQGGI